MISVPSASLVQQEALVFVRFGKTGLDHMLAGERTACGLAVPATAVRTNLGRHACPACEARHPGRIELIERVLDYLYQAPQFSIPDDNALYAGKSVTAWDFDGAEPFVRTELTHGGVIGWEGFDTPEPWQVEWPIDVRLITTLGAPESVDIAQADKQWVLFRYRGLRPQETRGRVNIALPYPMEMLMASPDKGEARVLWYGRAGPGRWVFIHRTLSGWAPGLKSFDHSLEYNEELGARGLLGLFLARQKRQQWRVYLGLEGRPGLELPTTPHGASEVFRLRDIPEGKDRRLALRHWVAEHWRTRPSLPDEEYQVREHMRGVQDFMWSGLRCKITPSRVDQERDQAAKEQRQEARRSGHDRRRRRR